MLAGSTLKEMHSARYLGNEAWTEAWGIAWYAVRKDDVMWVQHSGGLHGFITNVLLRPEGAGRRDRAARTAGWTRPTSRWRSVPSPARQYSVAAPAIEPAEPTPDAYRPLLGLYLPIDLGEAYRVEWRDAQLVFVDPREPTWRPDPVPDRRTRTSSPSSPGVRESGERVVFNRTPDGRVASVFMAADTWSRLEPVS